jgi:hypothetical protein
MAMATVNRIAGTQHSSNAWPTGSGATAVDPVRTRPRRNHLRQLDPEGANALAVPRVGWLPIVVRSRKDVALSPLNMRLAVADFAF